MPTFEQINRFYDLKLWTGAMVKRAMEKGVLTQGQYREIVGEEVSDG